jgi:type IV pilus biogenesis protein CpaD/CtpE
MTQRFLRAAGVLGLLLALMAARAEGCSKKSASPAKSRPQAQTPVHWITPLMTQPPPRPTVTMWPGVTRAPQLPE